MVNVLEECLVRPGGLVKVAAAVLAGLVSYVPQAIRSLFVGGEALKR